MEDMNNKELINNEAAETENEAVENESNGNILAGAALIGAGVVLTGGIGYGAYKLAGKIPAVARAREARMKAKLEKLGYTVQAPEAVIEEAKKIVESESTKTENETKAE